MTIYNAPLGHSSWWENKFHDNMKSFISTNWPWTIHFDAQHQNSNKLRINNWLRQDAIWWSLTTRNRDKIKYTQMKCNSNSHWKMVWNAYKRRENVNQIMNGETDWWYDGFLAIRRREWRHVWRHCSSALPLAAAPLSCLLWMAAVDVHRLHLFCLLYILSQILS